MDLRALLRHYGVDAGQTSELQRLHRQATTRQQPRKSARTSRASLPDAAAIAPAVVARFQLATELGALRHAREATQAVAESGANFGAGRLIRLERGMILPSQNDLSALLNYYEVGGEERARLERMRTAAKLPRNAEVSAQQVRDSLLDAAVGIRLFDGPLPALELFDRDALASAGGPPCRLVIPEEALPGLEGPHVSRLLRVAELPHVDMRLLTETGSPALPEPRWRKSPYTLIELPESGLVAVQPSGGKQSSFWNDFSSSQVARDCLTHSEAVLSLCRSRGDTIATLRELIGGGQPQRPTAGGAGRPGPTGISVQDQPRRPKRPGH
ncbi:MAG: helix-turn-helix domain-containing protein [Terriglobales bacterium]